MRGRSIACLLFLGSWIGLGACSGLAELGGENAPSLAAEERASVQAQAAKALAEGRYNAAWNQEVAAGAERARLEAVAVAALAGRSRHADGMFDALRERFGGLDTAARSSVDALVTQARERGLWARALDLEIQAADDPKTFTAAWAVYRAAPADVAPDLLEAIQEARTEQEEASD